MNHLIIYTTPPESLVKLKLDLDGEYIARRDAANERQDAHIFDIPETIPSQGALLTVIHKDYTEFSVRGILIPPNSTFSDGWFRFWLDDIHLQPLPKEIEPEPEPDTDFDDSNPKKIVEYIQQNFQFNLESHDECGKFTELCLKWLRRYHSPGSPAKDVKGWGHIRKNPAQNQYNGHAVDALMLMEHHQEDGIRNGIYDIIKASASDEAEVAFQQVGDVNPVLWYVNDQ